MTGRLHVLLTTVPQDLDSNPCLSKGGLGDRDKPPTTTIIHINYETQTTQQRLPRPYIPHGPDLSESNSFKDSLPLSQLPPLLFVFCLCNLSFYPKPALAGS